MKRVEVIREDFYMVCPRIWKEYYKEEGDELSFVNLPDKLVDDWEKAYETLRKAGKALEGAYNHEYDKPLEERTKC